jgi:MFS family permease
MRLSQLRRNRDFQILCAAQGVSRLGTQLSTIAFPLLVLRVTRSPADAGLVGFAEGVAVVVTLLPGGLVADRYSRRAIMLLADFGNVLIMTALGTAVLLRAAPIGLIVPVAVLGAVFSAFFSPAAGAALRLIVSDSEMPAAMSVNQARNATLTFAGPVLGGLLFEFSPALPFLADAGSYAIALIGTVAIRTQLTAGQAGGGNGPVLGDLLAGVRFIVRRRFLRLTMLNAAVLNFAFTGILLSVIITTVRDGSTSLTTGSVIALISGGTLAGSLLAPVLRRRLSLSQALLLVTWVSGALISAMVLSRNTAVLALLVAVSAVLIPALNVLLYSAQAIITPNALQGRVQSAISFIALSINPLGAAAAGFLLSRSSPAVAFACFGATILALAAVNTWCRAMLEPEIPGEKSPESHSLSVS